jgi:WD40 repeat protein
MTLVAGCLPAKYPLGAPLWRISVLLQLPLPGPSQHCPVAPVGAGSEDNTVRLWSAGSGAALQVLPHPGCVWAVAFTALGDLVTGCSDAVARVWSSTAERQVTAGLTGGPGGPPWGAAGLGGSWPWGQRALGGSWPWGQQALGGSGAVDILLEAA